MKQEVTNITTFLDFHGRQFRINSLFFKHTLTVSNTNRYTTDVVFFFQYSAGLWVENYRTCPKFLGYFVWKIPILLKKNHIFFQI